MNSERLAGVILYLSTNRGRRSLPFDWLSLTIFIASGLGEYLTGRDDFPKILQNRSYESSTPAFYQESFNKWLDRLLERSGFRLNPKLRNSFKEMLNISWVPKEGPSDGYNTNAVNEWMRLMTVSGHFSDFHGLFNFTIGEAELINTRISEELSEEENHHCEAIGRLIEKRIIHFLSSR